ncbi:18780_t:CDS:1, partial [Gigaspora rosea]
LAEWDEKTQTNFEQAKNHFICLKKPFPYDPTNKSKADSIIYHLIRPVLG